MPHEKLPLWHASDEFEGETLKHSATHPATPPMEEKSDGKSVQSWFKSNKGRRSRRNSFDPERALPRVDSERPLKPARNPPESTLADYLPLVKFFKWIGRTIMGRSQTRSEMEKDRRRRRKRGHVVDLVESHVPLEIILVLSK